MLQWDQLDLLFPLALNPLQSTVLALRLQAAESAKGGGNKSS
jgi:hypothetical protein